MKNKAFKKIISLFAVFAVALSILPLSGFNALAESDTSDNEVDYIELVSASQHKYIEHSDGCFTPVYDSETDTLTEYYQYYVYYLFDAVIKIVYKNGNTVNTNVGSWIDGYEVSIIPDQDTNPWTLGGENYATIEYRGATVKMPVTIIENPVASIEVISGPEPIIENTGGYFNNEYDMMSGQVIGKYFYYNYNPYENTVIKINFKDGSFKTAKVGDTVNEAYISYTDEQNYVNWTLGSDNYFYVTYLGTETKVPVTIIESPVEYIEINSAPTREYVYGDSYYGSLLESGEYHFYPSDLTGLAFTLHYKDGAQESFSYTDIDEDGKIGDYRCLFDYGDSVNPEIGDFHVEFWYMGKSTTYTVKLKESNVASIEVAELPAKTQFLEGYYPVFDGMKFKITYTDGSSIYAEVTEDNCEYKYEYVYADVITYVEVNGYKIEICAYPLGASEYKATYLGKSCKLDFVEFTESKEITSIELENFQLNCDGTIAHITYSDNDTQSLTLYTLYLLGPDGWNYGHAKTSEGIIYFGIETNESDTLVEYRVYLLGYNIEFSLGKTVIGDADGDGKITVKDLVRIKKIIAGLTTLGSDLADLNTNGKVDSEDLIFLRKQLLGISYNSGAAEAPISPAA